MGYNGVDNKQKFTYKDGLSVNHSRLYNNKYVHAEYGGPPGQLIPPIISDSN